MNAIAAAPVTAALRTVREKEADILDPPFEFFALGADSSSTSARTENDTYLIMS
jgi:hypothetical protein